MPRASRKTASERVSIDGLDVRTEHLEGGYSVCFEDPQRRRRPRRAVPGLPDEPRAQVPRWGYVIDGKVTFRFAGREETDQAGDAYYVPPGHTPVHHAGAEIVEFSPTVRAPGDDRRRDGRTSGRAAWPRGVRHDDPASRAARPGARRARPRSRDVRAVRPRRSRREDRGGCSSKATMRAGTTPCWSGTRWSREPRRSWCSPPRPRDVAAAVGFARDHGLLLGVKGGGHNIAGTAIAEGGLTLDMSRMREVTVDPGARLAHVGPGCLLGDVDRATQAARAGDGARVHLRGRRRRPDPGRRPRLPDASLRLDGRQPRGGRDRHRRR